MSQSPRSVSRDDGFTLIEVIIAISLLMIAAIAVASMAVQGLRLSSQQQRAQVAVTVATERMDEVQRLTTSRANLAALAGGRQQSIIESLWFDARDVAGVEHTYPAWTTSDPATPVVPITQSVTRSGSTYDSEVLVGTCYQPASGGACTLLPGTVADPGPDDAAADGMSRLVRVVVIVHYAGNCDGGCSYTASALFDTKEDLAWRAK